MQLQGLCLPLQARNQLSATSSPVVVGLTDFDPSLNLDLDFELNMQIPSSAAAMNNAIALNKPALGPTQVHSLGNAPVTASALEAQDTPKKKTRRRLRVSCVECTRRRQKCDRQQPCGLCKTRGVEHLCRWETEPFARPPPARPPGARASNGAKKLQPLQPAVNMQMRGNAHAQKQTSPSPSIVTVDQEVKEAAIALAQLSVAREGEYLGTGSLVSALHRLDDADAPQSPTDKTSGLPFFTNSHYSSAISDTFFNSLQALITGFPDKLYCDALITGFFEHDNWCIGVPQTLVLTVYDQMWETIQADTSSMSRINFHWVTLLFAIFALSSVCGTEDESRKYYLQALTAKRLGEDLLSASFNSAQRALGAEGAEFACLSAALLGKYMMDRGQMTEAWKTVGCALRNAQNAGLHRHPTPSRWNSMTEDEQILRCLSWHLCAMTDRFLSFILGRPCIIRARDCDVPPPKISSIELAPDGSTNTPIIFQHCLTALIDSLSEAKDQFLSVHPDLSDGSAVFEGRMAEWQAKLPPYFSVSGQEVPVTSSDHLYPKLHLQRTMLRGFYLSCCMLFHRSLPCALPSAASPSSPNSPSAAKLPIWDYDKIAHYAISLLHTQRLMMRAMWWQRQVCFTANFLAFEAAITLSIVLLRDGGNPSAGMWERERAVAIEMFQNLRSRDFGDIVPQAIKVLSMLQETKPRVGSSQSPSPGVESATLPTPSRSEMSFPGSPQDYVPQAQGQPLSAELLNSFWPEQLQMPPSMGLGIDPSQLAQVSDAALDWMPEGMAAQVTSYDILRGFNR